MTHADNDNPGVFAFFERFPDEASAREYLINARWPNGVICPHCGGDQHYRIRNGQLFRCKNKDCAKQFTVRIGTVMEDSPIPLRKWLFAMYVFGIHSKGVASTKMAEMIGVTQKTAWFMDHRLRVAFHDSGIVLDGIVEIDKTYVGGKECNKHARKNLRAGRGGVGETAVLGMKSRGGGDVVFAVNERVFLGATVHTDEHKAYGCVKAAREMVKHSTGENILGDVHTNGIKSVWALLKRLYMGIYHSWSKKQMHRYVNEITQQLAIYRDLPAFDDSDGSGITMIRLMIAGMEGRRLS